MQSLCYVGTTYHPSSKEVRLLLCIILRLISVSSIERTSMYMAEILEYSFVVVAKQPHVRRACTSLGPSDAMQFSLGSLREGCGCAVSYLVLAAAHLLLGRLACTLVLAYHSPQPRIIILILILNLIFILTSTSTHTHTYTHIHVHVRHSAITYVFHIQHYSRQSILRHGAVPLGHSAHHPPPPGHGPVARHHK